MCLLVCICYMSVGVYLIKMSIYNFACEIIVYIHRESQRDQHAVYVCCTLFAINFLDVDIHIYMTVWSIKLQCRIFFKIYGKLYVEHYFMCISIFFTGIRLIVLSIISMIGLLYFSMIFFFAIWIDKKLEFSLSYSWHFWVFFLSPNMYIMTVSFSSWLITVACLSKINKDKQQQLILYTLTQITHENWRILNFIYIV